MPIPQKYLSETDNSNKIFYPITNMDSVIHLNQDLIGLYYDDINAMPADQDNFTIVPNEDGKTSKLTGINEEVDDNIICIPYKYIDENNNYYIINEIDLHDYNKEAGLVIPKTIQKYSLSNKLEIVKPDDNLIKIVDTMIINIDNDTVPVYRVSIQKEYDTVPASFSITASDLHISSPSTVNDIYCIVNNKLFTRTLGGGTSLSNTKPVSNISVATSNNTTVLSIDNSSLNGDILFGYLDFAIDASKITLPTPLHD